MSQWETDDMCISLGAEGTLENTWREPSEEMRRWQQLPSGALDLQMMAGMGGWLCQGYRSGGSEDEAAEDESHSARNPASAGLKELQWASSQQARWCRAKWVEGRRIPISIVVRSCPVRLPLRLKPGLKSTLWPEPGGGEIQEEVASLYLGTVRFRNAITGEQSGDSSVIDLRFWATRPPAMLACLHRGTQKCGGRIEYLFEDETGELSPLEEDTRYPTVSKLPCLAPEPLRMILAEGIVDAERGLGGRHCGIYGRSACGTVRHFWGAVAGDSGNAWALETGRVAKKRNEGITWDWAPWMENTNSEATSSMGYPGATDRAESWGLTILVLHRMWQEDTPDRKRQRRTRTGFDGYV